uniref:LOB domain-containing protein n=1 Tax=Tanacetum cinerariifolium TaxID=118510 RepID=A0A6L2LXC6_TANCI|nr:hypothetical protein [Tanacetum cinerariifolium]
MKFAIVHKVFKASNDAKILNELSTSHREDVINSLAYEADARLEDPIYGCVGVSCLLGPSAMMPNVTQALMQQYANMQPMLGQMGGIRPVRTMLSGPTLEGLVSAAY